MNKHNKNLIISVDDFGISPLANKNILALIKAGKIDRVSLMANGSFTPKDLEKLKDSKVRIDIHLDIESKKKHRKDVKESAFLRGVAFSLKLLSKRMRSNYISIHWENQIEKFHTIIGRYPDGINTHQHLHYFPPYFKVAVKLAEKNKIPFIRFGKEALIPSRTNVYRILSWLHKKDKDTFISSKLESSDYMVSLDWIKKIDMFLDQKPKGSVEIVCHPERKKEFELIKKYF